MRQMTRDSSHNRQGLRQERHWNQRHRPPGSLDFVRGVQVVLETSWSGERERPVTDLPFVTASLLGKGSIVAEEDDAKPRGLRIIEPVVDSSLSGLVAEDRFVRLHQKVAAVEPGKLFDAGDGGHPDQERSRQ